MNKYCISKTALKILVIDACPLSRHCYVKVQGQTVSRRFSCVTYIELINPFVNKSTKIKYYLWVFKLLLLLLLLSWLMAFSTG